MLLAPELVSLIHHKLEDSVAVGPPGSEDACLGRRVQRTAGCGLVAMPQFCCQLPDINLTVQLQIGNEARSLVMSMHNDCT
jgi:hypothetical protein